MNVEVLEFDVMGTRVKFSPTPEERVASEDIVNLVSTKFSDLRKKHPELSEKDIAILTALGFAQEKLELKMEFKEGIENLESSINQALGYIEESSQTVQ